MGHSEQGVPIGHAKHEYICYSYDKLSRVTSAIRRNRSTNSILSSDSFSYDANGNILYGDNISSACYNSQNRMTCNDGVSFTYDNDGNMTYGYIGGKNMEFSYDSANRLISQGNNTYTYDVNGSRIKTCIAGELTTYVHDCTGRLSRLLVKQNSCTTVKYVYGLGLIGEENNGTFKTYHFDYRGSTVAITNTSGNVTDTFSYDTYGGLESYSGSTDTPFMYNGRDGVMSDSNGLIFMRARYYSPDIKRFINADVLAGSISDTMSMNRYAYANANPVSNVDPLGLSREESGIIGHVIDFFKNDTHYIYGEFIYGLLFGSGSVSGGNSEFGYSFAGNKKYYPKKDSNNWEGFLGALVDFSFANANGKIGLGNENFSITLNGDVDFLTAWAQAGINGSKDNLGFSIGAGASVLEAGIDLEIEVFGFGIEIGASGDVLSAEAGVTLGLVKKKGKTKFDAGIDTGAGWFGLGVDIGLILPF